MRIFCFSFSVYLVLLLTHPCQDLALIVDERIDPMSNAVYVRSSSLPDATSEECSPFCICSCCGHPATALPSSTVELADVVEIRVSRPSIVLGEAAPVTYQHVIWQPPKA